MAKGQWNCNASFSQCVHRERYDTPRKSGNFSFMMDEDSQISTTRLVTTPKPAALHADVLFPTIVKEMSDGNVWYGGPCGGKCKLAFQYTSSIFISPSFKTQIRKNVVLTGLVDGIITLGNRWYVTASQNAQVPPA